MTIAERIQLHRLGYTKEEIAELAKENYDVKGLTEGPKEPEAIEAVQEELNPAEPKTDTNAEILKALQGLTATIQKSNIIASRQPEQPVETAEDILSQLM